jgi:hypothetical protein
MTEWHEVTGPHDRNPVLVVRRGYEAEDHNTVTRPAAVVFDHGDQCVIQGTPKHLARILSAAADLLTSPDHKQWARRSANAAAADPIRAHLAAVRHLHHTNKRLARLIAETLTTQAPHAAYLVLGSSDSSQDSRSSSAARCSDSSAIYRRKPSIRSRAAASRRSSSSIHEPITTSQACLRR